METKHTPFKSQQIRNVKNHLKINQETFKNAFERLERSLDEELPKLSADVIPDIDYGELLSNEGKFDDKFSQKIRKHGVVIIRNVFDREYAEKLYKGLSEYMRTNGEDPAAFGTTFFEIYWSKEQVLILNLLHEYVIVEITEITLYLISYSNVYKNFVKVTHDIVK